MRQDKKTTYSHLEADGPAVPAPVDEVLTVVGHHVVGGVGLPGGEAGLLGGGRKCPRRK